jgi:hypothetical protein
MLITPDRSQTKPDIAPKINGIESSNPPCNSPVKGMNFPDAIHVRKDIRIPKLATAAGTDIDRPFLSATTAIALASSEIIEKIRAPVCDEITQSLMITHSSFNTKPKVVASLPGFRIPKYRNESEERAVIIATP